MSYATITVEGSLLPPDLLDRIATDDNSISGQKPADFGLSAGRRLPDEIQRTFSDARVHWDSFTRRLEHSRESRTTLTRQDWGSKFFELLSFPTLEYQRTAIEAGGTAFPISYLTGGPDIFTPVHIVAVDQGLDERSGRGRTPHALVQDYLNRSDSLWGMVTNGAKLRLLRDSARLSKPTYLEFDIQAMIEGNAYSEFVALYRLLHATRLPHSGMGPHECLLESYYNQGIEEGGRVREKLRDGVRNALEILGSALVQHPDSEALREALNGRLDDTAYYRQLLNFVYRMLFLMVTEERRLLFTSGDIRQQAVYDRYYSITHLRERAERYFAGDTHADLWAGLAQTFRLFRDDNAAHQLGLSSLNGELFGRDACRDIESASCTNEAFLAAMLSLSTFDDNGVRRRVNYAHLDVEEFGSVYESLLDYRPVVDLGGASGVPPRFQLAAGTERKQTGSYYTPPELVRELVESALVPVMEERLAEAKTAKDKEQALLDLRVCDPASGSGHFLLAAARRIARELARVRSGGDEPAPSEYRAALRDVVRSCLYGVDKNPLAVDLCKVALWIESHAAGLPLSFLDHHIKCGDSLLGVSDLSVLEKGVPNDAYKAVTGDDKQAATYYRRRNRQERTGQHLMALGSDQSLPATLAQEFTAFGQLEERSPAEVHAKEDLYQQLRGSGTRWWEVKTACDLWTYAYFAPQEMPGASGLNIVPTTDDVRKSLHLPTSVNGKLVGQASQAASDMRFFHWPLEFPEVFGNRGFDVVLGNPPFLGGRKITETFGSKYPKFLTSRFSPAGGGADLCALFFRMAFDVIASHGRFGMVASNTIGQGDTREAGLKLILQRGGEINFAHRFIKWPGIANVEVNLVAICKQESSQKKFLDDRPVELISSRLDSDAEAEATRLPQNSGLSFQGSIVLGSGFVVDVKTAQQLIMADSRNRDILRPYLTGQDINSRISQDPSRFVINFGERGESVARTYSLLWEIVEENVLPERIQKDARKYPRMVLEWWKFWNNRKNLYETISTMGRVLVRSRVSDLHMLAFAPTDVVFSDAVVVFAFDDYHNFALLQSNIHEVWVQQNASTMRTDIRYTPTDCFDTFPFPTKSTKTDLSLAQKAGDEYYQHRRNLMLHRKLGLTKIYNLYHDRLCQDEDIRRLRELHVRIDLAILRCYVWNDLDLGHDFYNNEREQVRFVVSPKARRELQDKLLELNLEHGDAASKPSTVQSWGTVL